VGGRPSTDACFGVPKGRRVVHISGRRFARPLPARSDEHDDLLVHVGGKSGEPPKTTAGMAVPAEELRSWFGGRHVRVRERL